MNPITTIIQNNTPNGRFATWTGSVKTWLPPNASVEVPFEVWSVCDKKQRDALIADLQYGTVTLAVRLLKPNGNYETVPYNPIAALAPQPPVQKHTPQPSPMETRTEDTVTSNKHIVQAGDKGMSDVAKQFHLKSETVSQPGVSDVADDLKDAVKFDNKALQEDHIQRGDETPVEPVDFMDKQAEAEEDEGIPEDEDEMSREQLEKEINELLSAKAYEEAHKILVEVYGSEKITFKVPALSRMKSFAAIAKKYKLDE